MAEGEAEQVDGVVDEVLPNALFRVVLGGGQRITAHISGRTRLNLVRLLPGDRVRVELSPYDRSRGRIINRLAN